MEDERPYGPFGSLEDKAEFETWTRTNSETVKSYRAMERDGLLLIALLNAWWYERVNTQWSKTLELVKELNALGGVAAAALPAAEQRGRAIGAMAVYLAEHDKFKSFIERRAQLAAARESAADKRRQAGRYAEIVTMAKELLELGRRPRDLAARIHSKMVAAARIPGNKKALGVRAIQKHLDAAKKKGELSV